MKKYILVFASLLLIASCSKKKEATGSEFSDKVKTIANTDQGSYFKIIYGNTTKSVQFERVFLDAGALLERSFYRQIRTYVPDYGSLYIKFAFPRDYQGAWKEQLYKEHALNPTRFLLEYSFRLDYVHSEAFFDPYNSIFQDKNGSGTVRLFEDKKIGNRVIKNYGEIDTKFYDKSGNNYTIKGYFWKDGEFQ